MDRQIIYLDEKNNKKVYHLVNYTSKEILEKVKEIKGKVIAIKKPQLCEHCQDGYIWIPDTKLERKFRKLCFLFISPAASALYGFPVISSNSAIQTYSFPV